MNSDMWAKVVVGVLCGMGLLLLVGGMGLLLAFPIKWTWNATMPYLFGWPVLTWGKAWCLYFLTGSLLGISNAKNSK